eukprot:scaffold246844_cov26-Tisochrysis_lutea.AAC.4
MRNKGRRVLRWVGRAALTSAARALVGLDAEVWRGAERGVRGKRRAFQGIQLRMRRTGSFLQALDERNLAEDDLRERGIRPVRGGGGGGSSPSQAHHTRPHRGQGAPSVCPPPACSRLAPAVASPYTCALSPRMATCEPRLCASPSLSHDIAVPSEFGCGIGAPFPMRSNASAASWPMRAVPRLIAALHAGTPGAPRGETSAE